MITSQPKEGATVTRKDEPSKDLGGDGSSLLFDVQLQESRQKSSIGTEEPLHAIVAPL